MFGDELQVLDRLAREGLTEKVLLHLKIYRRGGNHENIRCINIK